jgi:hypothetical protein
MLYISADLCKDNLRTVNPQDSNLTMNAFHVG